jgi:hypothetical protein
MISYPKLGQVVQLWYGPKCRPFAPHHGRVGPVVIRAAGRTQRNHGVEVDGRLVIVPAGNLRKPPER